jgi:DNA-binding GntR family transcriptional regulator
MFAWLQDPPTEDSAASTDAPLAKRVRDDVLARILSGELQPGQRINEPDVAARLGVSRVPVREALRELESSGLVAARKHAGVFVRQLTPREVADLYELRAVLDAHAGRRAATLPAPARAGLCAVLEQHTAEMHVAKGHRDVQAYYAANLAFHQTLVDAGGNAALALHYRGIVRQLHLSRLKNLSSTRGMQASMAEHAQIVTALSAGDAARCAQLMADHVNASHHRLNEPAPPAPATPRPRRRPA